jgi:GR25 family glycosyltransferase involved in LPS biosynthesis
MKINDYFKTFTKVYCLNLDRREDRWSNTVEELDKWGLRNYVTRVAAVDGRTLPVNMYGLRSGDAGLLETHLQLVIDAKKNNYKSILIIEDDIEFTDEVNNIELYVKELPDNWDMIWFGGNNNMHGDHTAHFISNKIIKCKITYTTHCVAINHTVFEKVIEVLTNSQKPVDVSYVEIQNLYNCYAFYPSIAIQRPGFSDILNSHQDYRWLL